MARFAFDPFLAALAQPVAHASGVPHPRSRSSNRVLIAALAASVALHLLALLLPPHQGGAYRPQGVAPLRARLAPQMPAPGELTAAQKSPTSAGRARASPAGAPGTEPMRIATAIPVPSGAQATSNLVRVATILDSEIYGEQAVQRIRGTEYHYYGSPRVSQLPPSLPPLSLDYPPQALARGEEGIVVLRILINELGVVDDIASVCGSAQFEGAVRMGLQKLRIERPGGDAGTAKLAMLAEFVFFAPATENREQRLAELRSWCVRQRQLSTPRAER